MNYVHAVFRDFDFCVWISSWENWRYANPVADSAEVIHFLFHTEARAVVKVLGNFLFVEIPVLQ